MLLIVCVVVGLIRYGVVSFDTFGAGVEFCVFGLGILVIGLGCGIWCPWVVLGCNFVVFCFHGSFVTDRG